MAELSLYAFTMFYLGRIHELFSILESTRIVLILTILATLTALVTPPSQKNAIWKEREVKIVVFLFIWALAMTPFSLWSGQTYSYTTGPFLRVILLFLLVASIASSPRVTRGVVLSFLIGIALLSAMTILAGRDRGGRAFASDMYDPNELAMVLDIALPFAALGISSMTGMGRLIAIASLAGGVVAVVKTVSRGGFIGLIVVALLLVLRWNSVSIAKRIGMLVAGVVLMTAAVGPSYWLTIGTIFNTQVAADENYLESGMLSRTELWKQGFWLWMKNPIAGVGVGTYEVAEGMSHADRGGKWSTAHNSFIQIGTEMGLVGFIPWLMLIVYSVKNARAVAKAARTHPELASLEWIATALEMALYTYIVVGFALSQGYSSLLFFMCGLATALRLQVRDHLAATPAPEPAATSSLRVRPS